MKEIADMTGYLTPGTLEQELKKLDSHDLDVYFYHMKIQHQESIQIEIALIKSRSIHNLQDGQIIRF